MRYVSPPLSLHVPPQTRITRADIHFDGVEQAGPSFEARVFLNNPTADRTTPPDSAHGYAGSFHVYGYGSDAHLYPGAPEPLRAPMHRYLTATEPVKTAMAKSSSVRVTVVPMLPPPIEKETGDPLKIERVSITFDTADA